MYFYTFFYPHTFSQNLNNVIKNFLPNKPYIDKSGLGQPASDSIQLITLILANLLPNSTLQTYFFLCFY